MGIQVTGIASLEQRATIKGLQAELAKGIQAAGPAMQRDMQAATFTPMQRKAMASVHFGNMPAGLAIRGGQGGGLGAVLFAGAEFGGRVSRKKHVRGYVFGKGHGYVTRRTTMQFLPHLGHEGYFFWPTVREWEPKLADQAGETAARYLTGGG